MLITFAVVETVLQNIVLLLMLVLEIFVLLFHIWRGLCVSEICSNCYCDWEVANEYYVMLSIQRCCEWLKHTDLLNVGESAL